MYLGFSTGRRQWLCFVLFFLFSFDNFHSSPTRINFYLFYYTFHLPQLIGEWKLPNPFRIWEHTEKKFIFSHRTSVNGFGFATVVNTLSEVFVDYKVLPHSSKIILKNPSLESWYPLHYLSRINCCHSWFCYFPAILWIHQCWNRNNLTKSPSFNRKFFR